MKLAYHKVAQNGLMQLMDSTAKEVAKEARDRTNRFN